MYKKQEAKKFDYYIFSNSKQIEEASLTIYS